VSDIQASLPAALPNLRTRASEDAQSLKLFTEAEQLALSLFDLTKPTRMMIPFFTDHTISHMQRVEETLDRMIYGNVTDQGAFEPTPIEAAFLLSAVWLHDIGMVYGIYENERSTNGGDVDWDLLRTQHEERASRYIQEFWQDNCSWSKYQKIQLAEVCIHHRRKHRLESFQPVVIRNHNGGAPIRLRELAALLRLADACHIDDTRTPEFMRNIYDSVGMPVESKKHWGSSFLIESILFSSQKKEITLSCWIPKVQQYGTAIVDFSTLVESVAHGLRDELDTVIPYLAPYSNVDFKSVVVSAVSPDAMSNTTHYVRKAWPNLISMCSSSGSETASMVAAVVMAAATHQAEMPRTEVEEILDYSVRLHPYNLLVRAIAHDVRVVMDSQGATARQLAECKQNYLLGREAKSNQVAALAKTEIDANDLLVVYGYSHAVMTLISEHLIGRRNKIAIVPAPGSNASTLTPDETARIQEKVKASGLPYMLVEMANLSEIFSRFKAQNQPFKVLLGTHGVFNGGDSLCTVGSSMVAVAAKAQGGRVLILAEPDKRVTDAETKSAMERLLAQNDEFLISSEVWERNSYRATVPVDCLTPEMYDEIIGVADPLSRQEVVESH
tara:strand:+ start:138597 stop:140435 length:1839 start_codon:yes stop_codon:yes gene_type:complete